MRWFRKTYDPDKFKLRIVPAWFSSDYVQFEYTRNGKTWHTIYTCSSPFLGHLDYNYVWERLSYRLGNGIFDHEKEKFSSYEKIKAYEEQQYKKYIDGNKDLERQREEIRERKKEAYKRANS